MTLIYELNLAILKMYPRTKHELSRSRLSKVRALQIRGEMRRRAFACDDKLIRDMCALSACEILERHMSAVNLMTPRVIKKQVSKHLHDTAARQVDS